jgi:CDP-glucose 4,6-dehydratase
VERKSSTLESLGNIINFWRNKKVIVTGHTGFKGSWLSLWLDHLGAEIIGLSLEPKNSECLFEKAGINKDLKSYIIDIRDLEKVKKVFSVEQPDIVFHLAAQPLVRYSYRYPIETYETNVMGTLNVLEAIRCVGESTIAAIMITTDKCYENREWEWGYRENEAMGGYDPYSSSKGAAELIISSYRKSYFGLGNSGNNISVASARSGNVIGGGDWAEDRLVPDIISAFKKRKIVTIRSPGSVRPWQHVLDCLSGYLRLGEMLYRDGSKYSEAWNFGPNENDAKSVQWIVERMCQFWGGESKWVNDGESHPHEANYLKLDCSKAHSKLGWYPKWDLLTALKETVCWHKSEINKSDLKLTCIDQIIKYEECEN